MKRVLALFLCIAMVILVGCAGDGVSEQFPGNQEQIQLDDVHIQIKKGDAIGQGIFYKF